MIYIIFNIILPKSYTLQIKHNKYMYIILHTKNFSTFVSKHKNKKYMIVISKLIKEKGYTIEEVAKKMGVSRISLAQTIAVSANPTVATLQRIADAIGCKVSDFFADDMTEEEANGDIVTIQGKRYIVKPLEDK